MASGAGGALIRRGVTRDSVQVARFNGGTVDEEREQLPEGYYLDRRDPDVFVLRRSDGSVVALFAADGASEAEIWKAAEHDAGN